METQLGTKDSGGSSSASSPGPPSPPSVRVITWAGALVVVSVVVGICIAGKVVVEAFIYGTEVESARAWKVGAVLAVILSAVVLPIDVFKALLGTAARLLPGGGSKS